MILKNKKITHHKIIFLIMLSLVACSLLCWNPVMTSAADTDDTDDTDDIIGDSGDDFGAGTAASKAGLPGTGGSIGIPEFLGSFAGAALALSGSIFLFLIIYGGIIIMTAAGDTNRVKKGKDVIVWAIIGVLILGMAYALTTLVFSLFNQ